MKSPALVRHTTNGDWEKGDRFPLYSALAASTLFIAIEIICPIDIALVLRLFVVGPILLVASIVVVICSIASKHGRRYRRLLLALGILWVISSSLLVYDFKHPLVIRSAARWIIGAQYYKNEVLGQPKAPIGELQHLEWDGWGWAGQDTGVFLVFDPNDALAVAAQSARPGKFNGIPCEVYRVRRLESHWYTVQNYTDQGWGECN
jgi:hypothetical protein